MVEPSASLLARGIVTASADHRPASPSADRLEGDLRVHHEAADRSGALKVIDALPSGATSQHLVLAAGIYPECGFAEITDASIVLLSSIAGLLGNKGSRALCSQQGRIVWANAIREVGNWRAAPH